MSYFAMLGDVTLTVRVESSLSRFTTGAGLDRGTAPAMIDLSRRSSIPEPVRCQNPSSGLTWAGVARGDAVEHHHDVCCV